MMSAERSFGVLLVSMSEYRIDGVFRYTGDELPRTGDLITVVDDQAGRTREARVRRVSPEDALAIHATDMTAIPPERWVAPHERVRRGWQEAERVSDARRGWLLRRRRRRSRSG
jgi:hypothetical protein